ncbi:hypothetical protein NK8_12460 [Caballeronia sp. NK8]|uniref:hypothetical protein n=1 Tax=Caballeronia sp. NK8 TaxID=140098 RepID=UPI001BB53B16|nr:hypothetical protein [Caballeronia sp. NK8]BCQ23121.1 hypothetical protein NK8_12460 [Caballeronia sp. NK8]
MTTEATLTLSADQQEVAQQKIRSINGAIGTIYSILKEGRALPTELATNAIKVAEFDLSDLCKALGIETFSSKEREERYAKLRAANMEIYELKAQLGGTVTPEATQECLNNMADRLRTWWKLEGCGHISEIDFGQYVCKVKFSCLLMNHSYSFSDTPVSDKASRKTWVQSLQERGFEIVRDDSEKEVLDSEKSRQAIIDLFAQRLPSADVVKFENFCRRDKSGFVLRGVEIYIRKIGDILALPVPSKEEA